MATCTKNLFGHYVGFEMAIPELLRAYEIKEMFIRVGWGVGGQARTQMQY